MKINVEQCCKGMEVCIAYTYFQKKEKKIIFPTIMMEELPFSGISRVTRETQLKNKESWFFIISGWCDTTGRAPYQRLAEIATLKGYKVVKINPDWDEALSKQIFKCTENDVILGFSMGAVLACMVAKKFPYRKLILASMTPVLDLSKQTLRLLGREVANDCLKFEYGGVKATYFYGEKEIDDSLKKIRKITKIKIVPNNCHQLSWEYIKRIAAEF